MRGATAYDHDALAGGLCFNPRAHAGRDGFGVFVVKSSLAFQSTRPCGARHYAEMSLCAVEMVSIHAPMRGATRQLSPINPTPWFQSTRPCGARHVAGAHKKKKVNVSIHAPMRGATPERSGRVERLVSFNPRAHAGRD